MRRRESTLKLAAAQLAYVGLCVLLMFGWMMTERQSFLRQTS